MHVAGHALRVAADIEDGTAFDPLVNIAGSLADAVLYVDLLRLVARECDIEPVEASPLQVPLPFELVEEVAREVPVTEEQPVPTARATFRTLLDDADDAERRGRPDEALPLLLDAIAVWRGDLAEDLELELLDLERIHLRSRFVRASCRVTELLTATGRADEAIETARPALEIDRWHEPTYLALADAYDALGDTADYIVEGMTAQVAFHEGEIIGVEIAASVELTVSETEPGVQGDRVSGARKPATLETGKVVQVPLFVEPGDKIRVDTRTGDYMTRV